MTAKESGNARKLSTELVQRSFYSLMKDLTLLDKHSSSLHQMVRFEDQFKNQLTLLDLAPIEFHEHAVQYESFSRSRYLQKILYLLSEKKPVTYENLLAHEGVGQKTIRALALVSEVIYGAKPSYRDPARYSFANGGKDATPYPVDRKTYDQTIRIMQEAVRKSRMQSKDKDAALEQLKQ